MVGVVKSVEFGFGQWGKTSFLIVRNQQRDGAAAPGTDAEAVVRWAENQQSQAFRHAGKVQVGLWWKVGKGGANNRRPK
jgi:hypothetical protein